MVDIGFAEVKLEEIPIWIDVAKGKRFALNSECNRLLLHQRDHLVQGAETALQEGQVRIIQGLVAVPLGFDRDLSQEEAQVPQVPGRLRLGASLSAP